MICNRCEYKRICVQRCKKEMGLDPDLDDDIDIELEKKLLDRCELNDKSAFSKIRRFYNNKRVLFDDNFDEFDWDVYK
jgi:hypothetical protein